MSGSSQHSGVTEHTTARALRSALEASQGDNQRLRDALELALNFHILARTPDDETIAHLRAALAGTPSEDA